MFMQASRVVLILATTSSTVSTNASMQSKLVDILRSTTTSSIVPGSYVLEMPTQEDRTATVIFPPGPKSLEDIVQVSIGLLELYA